MMRQGPISAFLHGVFEYLAAIVLIAAPFVLTFEDDAATAISIVVGVVVLVLTASSELPTGLSKVVPASIHMVLDFVLAAVLIAVPFLFGLTDDSAATAFFLVMGILHLLVSIATRYLPARATA
jgi:hypothetical protein